jgi:5-methylcytosine-specific restriction endonuclease McrA
MTAQQPVSAGTVAMLRRTRSRDRAWIKMFTLDAWIKQGCKCAYCHEPMRREDLTGDHVDPLIHGGSTKRENIKAACRPCNLTKGSMTEAAFLKAIKSPKPGCDIHIWLAWFRRRLWLRTERACKRIEAMVS